MQLYSQSVICEKNEYVVTTTAGERDGVVERAMRALYPELEGKKLKGLRYSGSTGKNRKIEFIFK